MKPRFLILLVMAIGLAVYFAMAKNKAPTVIANNEDEPSFIGLEGETIEDIRAKDDTLADLPLPGSEPAEEPEFDVRVEVDPSGKKTRLYLFISEKHGYYVESLMVRAWHTGPGVSGPEDSKLRVTTFKDIYLKANETLRTCMEVVPAELVHLKGDIGTSANWEADIQDYGRVRAKNPEPLPPSRAEALCDK